MGGQIGRGNGIGVDVRWAGGGNLVDFSFRKVKNRTIHIDFWLILRQLFNYGAGGGSNDTF